ncbi:MAG: YHS domain-containing protein [Candidatus Microsaccharimonas sp.]
MHDHEHHHHHHGDAPAVDPATLDDTQAICLVTGDVVVKAEVEALGHSRQHDGQTYYFCCATCVQLFDKNPEKYTHQTHSTDTLTLASKEKLVDNVWAFRFEADTPISWTPGQFIRVEVPHDNPDNEGTKRWFTISSTPHDSYIQITTRVTDTTFKQALAALSIGGTINLVEQPDGDFVWQESEKPLVFIAGGIGITPFYSMLKARGHSGQPVLATLIYNGRTDDLPFKAEFDEASKRHPEFHVHYVIGDQLTVNKLTRIVPELALSEVYVSGPEPMVEALGEQLRASGISDQNLHEDFFPHYNKNTY